MHAVPPPYACVLTLNTLYTHTGNWIAEFKKWCPSIHAVKMGGKRDERDRFIKQDLPLVNGKYQFDAVVTSYEGLLKEKSKFAKVPWKYLIIDEAHR